MGFLGGGGGGGAKPAPAPLPAPVPVKVAPEIGKAKGDLMERLRRARSRAVSRVVEIGLLEEAPPIRRPMLSDILG